MNKEESSAQQSAAQAPDDVHDGESPFSAVAGVIATSIEKVRESLEVLAGDRVEVVLESYSSNPGLERSALVQIIALDEDGRRAPIPGWKYRSDRIDEFTYLVPGDEANPSVTRFTVTVPEGAVLLSLLGMSWRKSVQTSVVGRPLMHKHGQGVPPFATALGTRIVWSADEYSEGIEVPTGMTRMRVEVLVQGTQSDGAKSPLIVSYFGHEGELLMGPENLPYSPRHGAFAYLEVTPGEQQRVSIEANLAEGVNQVRLHGVPWGTKTALIAERPAVTFSGESSEEVLLQHLLAGSDSAPLVIIDSTAPPLGKDSQRLRPNNLSYEFANMGMRVLFIPFGSTQGGPGVVAEGLVQLDRDVAPRFIEMLVEARGSAENYYLCTSFPSLENVARAEYLKSMGWTSVYEVRDDMEEFNRVGYSKWYHPLLERKMLSVASTTVTVSDALTRKMQVFAGNATRVHTIPNGVTEATVLESKDLRSIDQLEDRNASRTVGYVGHLTPSWFDWPLVLRAAKKCEDIEFEIIGHGKPDGVKLPRNVSFLGAKTHAEIAPIASRWKVGLIPFIQSPLTRGVDPNKIYEYFAWGMRVVSAPMGSVHEYPSTWVYRNSAQFEDAVKEAVSSEMTQEELRIIDEFALGSLWSERAASMKELMKGARK